MIRFLTAGESHGKALTGIIEGIPAGLSISTEYIQQQLKRRKLGYGRGNRQKIEDDHCEILSGVRHGKTLGSPIAILIENKDWKNWQQTMSVEPLEGEVDRLLEVPRPGHADYVGGVKYRHQDMRNVLERASARETTIRVALASVCRKFLQDLNVEVLSRVTELGEIQDTSPWTLPLSESQAVIDQSPLRCLGTEVSEQMVKLVDQMKFQGETLGGVFEVCVTGLPLGLGSYVQWDRRLEGDLAKSIMSLNAIKGVEVGLGFESARRPGSRVHDEIQRSGQALAYKSNRSGGINGGMSTGEPLVLRAAMKPISTLKKPLSSVSVKDHTEQKAHFERADICAVPSAGVIAESLVCFDLINSILKKFGGDSMHEIQSRVIQWKEEEGDHFGF